MNIKADITMIDGRIKYERIWNGNKKRKENEAMGYSKTPQGKGMGGIRNDDIIAAFDDISGSQPV